MTKAPAPSKASGKLSITFGLLSVPVDIFTATEDVAIKRQQFTRDGKKVGNAAAIKNDDGSYGDIVDRAAIVKKIESDTGVLIDLTDDEIARVIVDAASGTAQVVAFQPFGLLSSGSYVPNGNVWQVRASKLGTGRTAKDNPGGVRALALLLQALKVEQSFALLRFVKSGTPYFAALLPTGRLVGLYHEEEIREDKPAAPLSEALTEDEVRLAREYINAVRTAAPQTLTHPSVKVREYVEAKAQGENPNLPTEAPAAAHTDLFAALQASVEAAKQSKVPA